MGGRRRRFDGRSCRGSHTEHVTSTSACVDQKQLGLFVEVPAKCQSAPDTRQHPAQRTPPRRHVHGRLGTWRRRQAGQGCQAPSLHASTAPPSSSRNSDGLARGSRQFLLLPIDHGTSVLQWHGTSQFVSSRATPSQRAMGRLAAQRSSQLLRHSLHSVSFHVKPLLRPTPRVCKSFVFGAAG